MSEKPGSVTLRPLVEDVDADAAWLRASVEAFEPRLRELEQREEAPGDGAWSLRPDLGCGSHCRCCPPRRPVLDLDRWRSRQDDALHLARHLAAAVEASRAIVLGASSDPYADPRGTGAAHRSRSRELLAACRDLEGAELHLTTASPLVLCDLDLLVELDQASSLIVEMVVPTAHQELSRRLEPGAADPGERLSALGEVAAEGIVTHLRVAPLLPGITDGEAALRPLLDAAAAAGVVDVEASPLRLPWRARRPFFAWLQREFPELLPRYRRLYRWRRTLPAAVRQDLLSPFHRLRLAHGFPQPHAGRG